MNQKKMCEGFLSVMIGASLVACVAEQGPDGGVGGENQASGGQSGGQNGSVSPDSGGSSAEPGGGSSASAGGAAASSGGTSSSATGGEDAGSDTGGSASVGPAAGEPACGVGEAGWAQGDYVPNFTLLNQDGEEVSMSDFCGKVVWIDMGAMWCPACRSIADEDVEPWYQARKDKPFAVLSIMAEDARGRTPDAEALSTWQQTYDITTDILADPDWSVVQPFLDAGGKGAEFTPWAAVIMPDGEISFSRNNASERHLDDALEEAGF